MENKSMLKRNVYKDYIFTVLRNLDLSRGIWMIYIRNRGMSLTKLGLLETIFHITSFCMEVPTGAVADIFGRKVSRIIGRFLFVLSIVLMFLSKSFYLYAICFAVSALSYNLESGAGDALIYDSLKEIGEEESYIKISGKKEMFYQISSTIAFFLGGYIASKSYSWVFILTIAIAVITLIQSFGFKEPNIGRIYSENNNWEMFIKQLKESIAVIKNDSKIGFLIIFCQTISVFCTCIFFYLQNYLKASGIGETSIGIMYAVSSITAAITSTQVYKIENRIKERGILTMIPFLTLIGVWGVALSKYSYIYFIFLEIAESIIYVSINDFINKRIPSQNRATILSFSSMVFSLFMIVMFPLVGMIGDNFSLQTAFKVLGGVISILVIINYFVLSSPKKYQKQLES